MKTILITGATKGIGRATASELLKKHCRVIGTSRFPGQYPHLFEDFPLFSLAELDLNNPRSIDTLPGRIGPVDVIIHNAGISHIGAAEETSPEHEAYLFNTNYFGITALNRKYLPIMRSGSRAFSDSAGVRPDIPDSDPCFSDAVRKIIHIGSLSASIPLPFSSLYAASKAALFAYSRALRAETAQWGIDVTYLLFDHVRTGLPQLTDAAENSPYSNRFSSYLNFRNRSIAGGMDPIIIAKTVTRLVYCSRMPSTVPIGSRTRARLTMLRILPSWVRVRLTASLCGDRDYRT